jgi:RNA polymerase sigma-70 factor, ECF subfamily
VRLVPTPVVALNHAVAVGMAQGCALGLAWVDRLGSAGELEGYALYHAARADLLRRLGRMAEAAAAYQQALVRTTNWVERVYLERRIREVAPDLPSTPVENPG